MKARLLLLALLAPLAVAGEAAAQSQSLSSEEAVTTVDRPKIPGYFDRITSTFRPLGMETLAPTRYQGRLTVEPKFEFHRIGLDETVFCEVTISFGDESFDDFFVTATARGSVNFNSSNPPKSITVPFLFDGEDDAMLQVSISCRTSDSDLDDGAAYSQTITEPRQEAESGNSRLLSTLFL